MDTSTDTHVDYTRNSVAPGTGELRFTLNEDHPNVQHHVIPAKPAEGKRKARKERRIPYVAVPSEAGELRYRLSRDIYADDGLEGVGCLTMDVATAKITRGPVAASSGGGEGNGGLAVIIFAALKKAKQLEPMAQHLVEAEGYSLKKARIIATGLGCTK